MNYVPTESKDKMLNIVKKPENYNFILKTKLVNFLDGYLLEKTEIDQRAYVKSYFSSSENIAAFLKYEPRVMSEINDLQDAVFHYLSLAGGIVPATDLVDTEIRNYPQYITNRDKIKVNRESEMIKDRIGVFSDQGSFLYTPDQNKIGLQHFHATTVGSVELYVNKYEIEWEGLAWHQINFESLLERLGWPTTGIHDGEFYYRTVNYKFKADYFYKDTFDFVTDSVISIYTDLIPSLIIGEGKGFDIQGTFSEPFNGSFLQVKSVSDPYLVFGRLIN